ncbi:hypothetical protein AB6D11_06345 [Vibrio splendidus]
MDTSIKIGTLTIAKPYPQELSHEVAAWRTTLEIPAGEFPIYLTLTPGRVHVGALNIPAEIKSNYSPSMFGGVQYGGRDGSEDVGKTHQYTIGISPHMLPEGSHPKEGLDIEFDPGVSEWLSVTPWHHFKVDFEHEGYREAILPSQCDAFESQVRRGMPDKVMEHADGAGFFGFDMLSQAVKGGRNRFHVTAYRECIAIDVLLSEQLGKGAIAQGVTLNQIYDHWNKAASLPSAKSIDSRIQAALSLVNEYDLTEIIKKKVDKDLTA